MSVNRNFEQELDCHDARTDFENLLQGILAKANAEEKAVSEHATNEEDMDSSLEEPQRGQKSIPDSPQKASASTPKAAKKRRKRDEMKDDKQKPSTFIMKLFDRSVDLASFNDQTPLYPVCRAWMENDPSGKNKLETMNGTNSHKTTTDDESASNSEDEEAARNITKIPPPDIPWNNINDEGKYVSPRVPMPLPQPKDRLDKYVLRQTVEPAPEALLVDHLRHWKRVKETWKAKSIENDARYREGMDLLRDVFQRNVYNNSTGQ